MQSHSRLHRVAALLALVVLLASVLQLPAPTLRALAAASAAPASSATASVAAATTTTLTAASPSVTVDEGQVAANSGAYSHNGPGPLSLDVSVGRMIPPIPGGFALGPTNSFTIMRYWQLGEDDPGAADGVTGNTTTAARVKSGSFLNPSTGNNLTRQGSPSYTAVDGANGSVLAMSFNGSTDGYILDSITGIVPTDNFGVEARVKPNGGSGPQVVVYYGETPFNGFGILIDDAGHAGSPTYWVRYGGVTTVDTGVAVTPGIWQDVALIRDQGATKLFVDAALAYNSTIAAPNVPQIELFGIGQDPHAAGDFYSGAIDDVRFFYFNAGTFSVQDLAPNQSISGAWSWTLTTDDGPAESQSVTLTASTGVSGETSSLPFALTVTNVAPTASFSSSGTASQGSTATVSFSGPSDVSAADRAAGFHYAYDFNNDGAFEVGDGSYAGSGAAASATVPASFLTGVASRTVRGRIIDKDGGSTDYTTTITIISGVAVNEGQAAANSGPYSHHGPAPVTISASVGSVSQTQTSSSALNVAGYWQLGEDDAGAVAGNTANTTTLGQGANGLNPTLNLIRAGSPTYTAADGANGSVLAMSFNGSADGYTLANPVSSATDNFGMEAWVRIPASSSTFQPIVYNGFLGNSRTPGDGFGLAISGGNFAVIYGRSLGGTTTINSGVGATTGVWHHVALVRDGGVNKIYVDGVRVTLSPGATALTPPPATSRFAIGNSLFVGSVDDVRVFTFAPGAFNPQDLGINTGVSGAWSWSYTADDGPAQSQNVTITASTGVSGETSSTSFPLSVTNVAPTAALSNNGPVIEGSTATVSFSGQSDASAADTAAGFHYAYDFNNDGAFEVGDGSYAGSGAAASAMVPASFLTGIASRTVRGRIIDKDGGSTNYTTTITVTAANHAPVAANDSYNANQDAPLTVAAPGVLANDTDADSNPLTAAKLSDPAHGAVTLNANGSFTYTPATGYSGSDSFTYKANDGTADSNVATVSITVISNWSFQGPAPELNPQQSLFNVTAANQPASGAVTAIAASKTNPSLVYIGGANGGVWKSTNATAANPTWTPLTDNLTSQSISAIAFDPADDQKLIVGTNQYSGLNSIGDDRAGVYYTTDGGATWTTSTGTSNNLTTFSGNSVGITGVAARGNTLLATTAQVFLNSILGGLFRTTTGPNGTWTKISGTGGLPNAAASFIVGDPSNSNVLYVGFLGASGGVFKSTDTGATWTNITNGIPFTSASSTGFGISAKTTAMSAAVSSDGSVVYVALNGTVGNTTTGTPANDVYRSVSTVNSGTFTELGAPATLSPSNTFFVMSADKTNKDLVYLASSVGDVFRLDASGALQTIPLAVAPAQINPGVTTATTSLNVGATAGFPATPFVITVDSEQMNVTGMNATTLTVQRGFNGTTAAAHTAYSGVWVNSRPIYGAPHVDYRSMAIDANGGLLAGSHGGIYRLPAPGGPASSTNPTNYWVPLNGNLAVEEIHDIAYDHVSHVLIAGLQDNATIFQSAQGNQSWSVAPSQSGDGGDVAVADIGGGQSLRYASSQNLGGFRRYVYNAANGLVTNTAISISAVTDKQFVNPIATNAVNPNFLLIGGSGHTYESTDQGVTIAALADPLGVNSSTANYSNYKGPIAYGGRLNGVANPYVLYIGNGSKIYARTAAGGALAATAALPGSPTNLQGIALNPNDYTNVFAVDNTHVYASSDGGATWSNITGNLLSVSSTQFTALAFVPGTSPYIAVGTRSGVFASPLSSLGTWAKLRNSLPDVPVFDLAYDTTDDVLAAGTLGRAAWTLPRASVALNPVAALALNGASTAREAALAAYAGTGFSLTSYIAGLSASSAAPTASASGPAAALAGQVVTFVLQATDSSPANQAAGFTYSIDWGDSSPIQTVDPVAGNGDATARHAFPTAGSYNVHVTATNQDGATSAPASAAIAINALTASSLQTLIGATPIVYLQPASDSALHSEVTAINGLSAPASHVDITIILGAGPYSGVTLSPPDGITLDLAGAHTADVAGTQIASSSGSAVTVTSGDVFVQGVGLSTSADAPTVLVTGGHLTIAQNDIQESTGANNVAVALTGGEVELGMDMLLNINGLGSFFSTYDPDAIGFPEGIDADLTPNTYELNGVPISASHLSATDLASSANPSVVGQAVTFTADIDAEAGENGPATGTVTFYDGTTVLGSGTLSPVQGDTFTASFTTSALSAGTHTITAVYGGNSVYVASSAALRQIVQANHAPVAANDSYNALVNTALTASAPGVLANDTDADGNALTTVKMTNPAHGTLTLNANGSFTYRPAAGYVGPDSFTYKANDGTADSNVATVSIAVKYAFAGFFGSVANPPTLNQTNAGQNIAFIFNLGGNYGLNIFASGYPVSQQINCSTAAPIGSPLQVSAALILSYSPTTGRYTYTAKTDKTWAGTCRQFNLRMIDGTDHFARFKFK